ncbi:MAG: hypothetical protein PHH68_01805 [Candidatus Omnitrophica bacterium]|nr:hypothetical protein [Candidatus Omnitrophota bacterium]
MQNIKTKNLHAHIHSFDVNSLDFLKSVGFSVHLRIESSPLLKVFSPLIDAIPIEHKKDSKYPKIIYSIYNIFIPITKNILNSKVVGLLIQMDEFICKLIPLYQSMVFVIVKDKDYYMQKENMKISANQIMNISVPYYYFK